MLDRPSFTWQQIHGGFVCWELEIRNGIQIGPMFGVYSHLYGHCQCRARIQAAAEFEVAVEKHSNHGIDKFEQLLGRTANIEDQIIEQNTERDDDQSQ